jgi:hypothetical protein
MRLKRFAGENILGNGRLRTEKKLCNIPDAIASDEVSSRNVGSFERQQAAQDEQAAKASCTQE